MNQNQVESTIRDATPEIESAMLELVPQIREAISEALNDDKETSKVSIAAKLVINLTARSWTVEAAVSVRHVIKSDAHRIDDPDQIRLPGVVEMAEAQARKARK